MPLDIGRNLGGDGEITIKPTAVASLPAAASTNVGAVRVVTDAVTTGYTLVISNGTNWVDVNTGTTVTDS